MPQSRKELTARSVLASTLLGMQPPRLPTRLLVSSGCLFGIAEGATRVAISRMVAAGELEPDGDGYRLAGALLARQARQEASRRPPARRWTGDWRIAVVRSERRPAGARAELREAMRRLHLAERRDGVWLRPDNLPDDRVPDALAVVDAQCEWLRGRPDGDATTLAASLWDLDGWARDAEALRAEMADHLPVLEAGGTEGLAPGFVLDAAVVRHLLADPLLPGALLPARWPGGDLRHDFERYDRAYKDVWRAWFRAQR
ncbi:MAG: PaaX family transcriptional regulator C-terminal domain-containing protein [Acidimicrobiales bacterium]